MKSGHDMRTSPLPSSKSASTDVGYRAICPTATLSVVLGGLSILLPISWYLVVIPLAGLGFGWKALKQIRMARNEWTGEWVAKTGLGLSAGFLILGATWLIFAGARAVPYGYQLIKYEDLQPDPMAPADPIPQTAQDTQDKKVFVRGFMQARRKQTGIKEFILCPSNGDCQFCTPNPKRTEMIRVVLQGDLETTFTTRQIGVGGRFQVDPADPGGIPYTIEADCLR